MTLDGHLSPIFQAHLPFFFQRIETGPIGPGTPDLHYCHEGVMGWIENKITAEWAVTVEPAQVGWAERYVRHGGRIHIAVRRLCEAGPRRVAADELWLFHGADLRALKVGGLKRVTPLLIAEGGPASWDWPKIQSVFKNSS